MLEEYLEPVKKEDEDQEGGYGCSMNGGRNAQLLFVLAERVQIICRTQWGGIRICPRLTRAGEIVRC